MAALTMPGFLGWPARRSSLLSVAADSDAQFLLSLPPPVRFQDGVAVAPVENRAGRAMVVGEMMCWHIGISPGTRQYATIPNALNQWDPAGPVVFEDIPDGETGYVAVGGVPVNVKVLGSSMLNEGSILEVVPGQTYLQATQGMATGGGHYPFVLREDHFQASTVLRLVRIRIPQ